MIHKYIHTYIHTYILHAYLDEYARRLRDHHTHANKLARTHARTHARTQARTHYICAKTQSPVTFIIHTSTHSRDPMIPSSSAPHAQKRMVRRGRQPTYKDNA